MSTLLIIILFIVVLIVFAGVSLSRNMEKNRNVLSEAERDLIEQHGEGDYHLLLPGPRCIGVAWDAERLIIGDTVARASVIPFADIRDANIELDQVEVTTSRSTTRTNRGSQAIGGIVGGLALGPAGLLVGGLSGSSTTIGKAVAERQVKSVKLIVRIADRRVPLRSFEFAAISHAGQAEVEKAAHYHALLSGIIEDRSAAAGPGIGKPLA